MKTRSILLIVTLLALGLVLGGTASAQAPEPPRSPAGPSYGPPQLDAISPGDETKPFLSGPAAAGDLSSADAPDIAIGQPGLSFRYVQTLGETETAYPEDSSHFYNVQGLGVDGNQIWVTDSWSDRVLKFDASGNFLQQIGKAGFRDSTGTSLSYVTDVAVDSGGNIWVVDADAAHVVKYNAAGNKVSELGQAWTSGSDNAHFNNPISIAFDVAGNIYVSDSGLWGDYGNHRVQVFNSSGAYLATIGQTGVAGSDNGHFRRPRGIAVYGNRLYVADAGNHRVQIFDITNPASPSYVATVGTGVRGNLYLQFDFPEGVGVDANYIYVADSNNQRVQIFDRNTLFYNGLTIGAGTWGTDNNHFNHPTDVAVDAAGNIYVADNWNKRVQQFNSSRVYQRTYGTTGVSYVTDGSHYYFPKGVAVGQDGSIHIVEERGHRLVKLDANGAPQWTVGQPGQNGNDNNHFAGPQDVAVDAQGRVYVTENWDVKRVQIFNSDGTYYATLGAGSGTGPNQFQAPEGITIDSTGMIYVADRDNHRVQIFNSARAYVATLGQTGVSGNDNSHFNRPIDIAVDGNGIIYVADEGNDRVQVFDSSRNYLRTIGGGGTGSDFGHFDGWGPHRLAVDAQNRLYVADSGNNRVQVFDAASAYLTTIGGSWGNRTGQFRGPFGIAIGPDGAVFVADRDNNRIQKFAPGVSGWRQVNINGFGDRNNRINSLASFGGQLYAGAYNFGGNGAQLWRMNAAGVWASVSTNGFGDTRNVGIDHLAEFNGQLYAGIWSDAVKGGEIWRSSDGQNWTRVASQGFGDPTNGEVFHLTVFSNTLYATTWSYTTTHGTEIWRSSDGQNWSQVVSNGLGDATNQAGLTMEAFNGALYVGTRSVDAAGPTGCEVWRTADGVSWTKVITDGFGNTGCYNLTSMAVFQDYLYAGTAIWDRAAGVYPGGEIWRCSAASGCDETADWTRVATRGFNKPDNTDIQSLVEFGNHLYAVARNAAGLEIWRTADGTNWAPESTKGFGDSNNAGSYWDNSAAVHNNHLYIGTTNSANGGEIWLKTLTADFTATPTRGAPPLTVQFTNTSSGDFTLSEWDFGDGVTSTMKVPTHTYTLPGIYTVTLTVSNKTDTSTITKVAYIDVHRRVFLPLVMKNYDPWLYDDFNDPAWEGAWNPAKWRFDGNAAFKAQQQNGVLVLTNLPFAGTGNLDMVFRQPENRSLRDYQLFQARMKFSSDRQGGSSDIWLHMGTGSIPGYRSWQTACYLGGNPQQPQAHAGCLMLVEDTPGHYVREYATPVFDVNYDTWTTLRMKVDPNTAEFIFYADDVRIGSHIPADAATLLTLHNFGTSIAALNFAPNVTATRYVDDVRITPAQ